MQPRKVLEALKDLPQEVCTEILEDANALDLLNTLYPSRHRSGALGGRGSLSATEERVFRSVRKGPPTLGPGKRPCELLHASHYN